MIKEITLNNIDELKEGLLDKKQITEELGNNPFGKYLVLEEDDKTIGYLYYSDIYERAEINRIEINYFHRNCGKGTNLLKALIESVDKSITLEVNKENKVAIKLYKANGFIETAIRKGYYDGVDGILMERIKK